MWLSIITTCVDIGPGVRWDRFSCEMLSVVVLLSVCSGAGASLKRRGSLADWRSSLMYKMRKSLSSDGEVKYKPNIEAKYVDDSGVFSDLCYIAPRKGEAVNQRWGVLFEKHDDKYLIPLWAECNKNPALEGALEDSGRFASTGSNVTGGSGYIGRIMEDDEKRGELRGCSTRLNRLFKKLLDMRPDFAKTVTANAELSKKKSDKMLLIIEICKYSKNVPSALGPPDKGAQFIDTDGTLKKYAAGKPAQSSGTHGAQQQYVDRRDDDEDDDDEEEEEG